MVKKASRIPNWFHVKSSYLYEVNKDIHGACKYSRHFLTKVLWNQRTNCIHYFFFIFVTILLNKNSVKIKKDYEYYDITEIFYSWLEEIMKRKFIYFRSRHQNQWIFETWIVSYKFFWPLPVAKPWRGPFQLQDI